LGQLRNVHLRILRSLPLAVLAGLVLAAPAAADITGASFSAPADGAELFYDADNGSGSVTVRGAVAGASAGAKGDLICFAPSIPNIVLATGVDVSGGGFAFTASLAPAASRACRLALVPAGTTPTGAALTPFAGPAISVTNRTSLSNNGQLYDYDILVGTLQWSYELGSLGRCAVKASFATDPASLQSPVLFGPSLCLEQGNTGSVATPTQSSLQIDGLDAFVPAAVGAVRSGGAVTSPGLTGQPGYIPLDYHATFDAAHDTVTIDETDVPMICDPPASYPPSPSSCPSLHDSGIRIAQHVTTLPGGQVARVTDTISDVDGRAHTIAADFRQSIGAKGGPVPGFEFPNQTSFATHAKPDTFTTWLSGPQSIVAIRNPTAAPSLANPIGTLTLGRAPLRADFVSAPGAGVATYLMHYLDSLPAGGSLVYDWSFAQAASSAALTPLERLERDRMLAPSVVITHPPNGAVSRNSRLRVTGRATDNVGVASFTVNGLGVALAPDGSFSTIVRLRSGRNTIVAAASDAAGNTTTASAVVTFRPTSQCRVPRLRGLTVAAARRALGRAHCALGRIRKVRATRRQRGRVLSTNPAARSTRVPGTKVAVSVGR
jgi:hypothetical protein